MNKQVLIGLSTLSLVTILSGIALSSSNSSAASASTATATVKIATSCTLTTTGGGNYSATVPNGTSAEIPGSTLSVSCNDAGGFALYAVGYSNDTIGNNNMIGQSTNIATNTSGTDSYWAMKINPTTGTTPTIENSFNNYHIVPNAHTKVASYASSTGTGSLSVNATYKASVSSTQLAGNYLGKVKYTLIHPAAGPAPVAPLAASDCPALSICYAPNADDIEGTMLGIEFEPVSTSLKAGRQSVTNLSSTVKLRAYNYSRPGYGFAGWSPSYEASTAPGSTDIIYGPQATVVIKTNNNTEGIDVSTNGLILYPVWVASTGTMQTFTSANCNAMNVGDVTARTDIRDDETYTIAKLIDGKCWMVENLRLDHDGNINPTNTQSNNNAFGGVFTGLATSEYGNSFDTTTANSLYSVDGTTANVISDGSSNYWRYRIPRYNNDNTNRFLAASYDGTQYSTHTQWYGFGNYYNWPAAIADTTFYDYNPNQSIVSTSLCPTNWRLPKGGNDSNEEENDFWTLIVIGVNNGVRPNRSGTGGSYYGGLSNSYDIRETILNFPYNFVFTKNNTLASSGTATYLTSTNITYDYMNAFSFNYSDVYPGNSRSKKGNWGYSIRCIASS